MHRGDSYREVLANRSFRALWLGQALSHLGQSIIYVVVALYVYELTGSARQVSFAVALELLPFVVIGPLAGLLADRLERKGMLVAAFSAQAALVGLLPFTTSLAQLYVLVFLSSLLAPVTSLVWAVALPSITGQRLFIRGSSLGIVAYNAANVLGPIVGGWLVSLMGARPVFFLVVGCFVAAASLSIRAASPVPTAEVREPLKLRAIRSEMVEGIQALLGSPVLRYLVLLNCISSLGWSAPSVAAVVYLTDILGLGGREYGLLRGAIAMSIGLGVYVLGRYSRLLSRQRLLVGGVVLAGLAYMFVLVQPGLLLLLALWFVSGLGWAANWLIDQALWAQVTPDRVRGRVYSLAEAIISLAEVGTTLLGGWLVSARGPIQALFIIGLAISTGSVAVAALARPLRHVWPREGDGGLD
ncbi:MAG: MFS transporter [Anaerolineae bacterium]